MFMKLSDRDAFGRPNKYRTLKGALPGIETLYSNPGGSGDRTSIIDVSQVGNFIRTDSGPGLVDGGYVGIGVNPQTITSASHILFDFKVGNAPVVQEIKFLSSVSGQGHSYGTWKWYGSTNNVEWSEQLGSDYTLTDEAICDLSANNTGYRYLKLVGTSGVVEDYYIAEFEFKISTY